MSGTREVAVDYLARVEGEGAMRVKVVDDQIEDVEFSIFEPPRFFEAFMLGRPYTDAPDITARICGICPIAYQVSSVNAMEDALEFEVGEQLTALRRLIYCGEWIESHVLHVYLLHAPDFLGYESAIHMAADHREIVERGLRLKKAGNAIVTLLGGREIHPINLRVGGFHRAPTKKEPPTSPGKSSNSTISGTSSAVITSDSTTHDWAASTAHGRSSISRITAFFLDRSI